MVVEEVSARGLVTYGRGASVLIFFIGYVHNVILYPRVLNKVIFAHEIQVYGYMPLRFTVSRADSVMYNTKKKTCFKTV